MSRLRRFICCLRGVRYYKTAEKTSILLCIAF
nr:MAG TPA: hypothetical protein [Caudoviricetes sp.]DAT97261.1 MAG TPA: hypothetical protein [Caudoviricetes sp.]